MKILVLTSRFPYPLEKGDKLRVFYQIKELSKQHELILCSLSDEKVCPEFIDQLKPYCSKIYVYRIYKYAIYLKLIPSFLFGNSLQVSYFYNYFIKKKIEKLIYSAKPDHIYCQLIRMTEYVKDINHIDKSLDFMDALSMGMKRRAIDSPFPLNIIFREEARRLSAYESQIFYDFDLCTIISEQDRSYIANAQRNEIAIVPNGVDLSTFEFTDNNNRPYDLLFVGNMSYYPNVKAAEYLAKNVIPVLHKKGYKLKLTIAGANPNQQVKNLQNEWVEVLGWVNSIQEVYNNAKVFVAPLFHGSGLQNKILEAMACGVPVVTTKQTNNAVGAMPDSEILLAEDEISFSEQILYLLNNPKQYENLQLNARTFVEQNFSWEYFVNQLNQKIIET